MMYTLTILVEKKSLTLIVDIIRYLGNRTLTKKWSDGFSKPPVKNLNLVNKIAYYRSGKLL